MHETTGDRDLALSLRHREWGHDCPSCDVDFLVAEYDRCKSVALVDYKRHWTTYRDRSSELVLKDLADRAELPLFTVRYWQHPWRFEVEPKNGLARRKLRETRQMSERRYVQFLYYLRGRKVPDAVLDALDLHKG